MEDAVLVPEVAASAWNLPSHVQLLGKELLLRVG
jgi:hypothetical protein